MTYITVYYIKPPAGSGAAPKSNMLIFLQQDLPKESHKWDKLKAVKSLVPVWVMLCCYGQVRLGSATS